MKTLADIMTIAERAAKAGKPVARNWPQVRGALLLLNRAIGLENLPLIGIERSLPEFSQDLDPNVFDSLLGTETYRILRREILRLVALYIDINDPWEALRALIRQADRPDIENVLYHLRAPAMKAGLSPAEITSSWVLSRDRELGPGSGRLSFRRGVTGLNQMFQIPAIVASGLLPPKELGPFPTYDRIGHRMVELPSQLRAIHDESRTPGSIASIWQAICHDGGFDLPDNPGPNDLLAPEIWDRIKRLSGDLIGVSPSTFEQYRERFRRALRAAAADPALRGIE